MVVEMNEVSILNGKFRSRSKHVSFLGLSATMRWRRHSDFSGDQHSGLLFSPVILRLD